MSLVADHAGAKLICALNRYSEELPTAWTSSLISPSSLDRHITIAKVDNKVADLAIREGDNASSETAAQAPLPQALTKSFSLLFGLGYAQ